MEKIYTIPVNEAFEAAPSSDCKCPFCLLYKKLQDDNIEIILGASMMEPDIRIKTNQQGFCDRHYAIMRKRNRLLGMALMLESHFTEVEGLLDLPIAPDGKAEAKKSLAALETSCYICSRIEKNISAMFKTAVYLYEKDADFLKKFDAVEHFCIPHYRRFVATAKKRMPKKVFADFYNRARDKEKAYVSALKSDVSWFAKKFDYRYDKEPWYNSKGSVDRAIRLLCGDTED